MAISKRAQQLMKALVENYLMHGQPIGSSTLAKISDLSVSPATIRNVMSELEHQGLVESPHTSAGRIPTDLGFRLFVDHLLTVQQPGPQQVAQINTVINPNRTTQDLLTNTSTLLSELTSMVGLVKVPFRDELRLKHIEFMPLTEKRILVILVLEDHQVQNRVIYTEESYTTAQLTEASNYLNQHLAGQDIRKARVKLLEQLKHHKQELNQLMALAIELADKGFSENNQEQYHLSGDNNLIEMVQAPQDLNKLKAIFEAFRSKQDVLALLDKALNADGVQIFIGEECASEGLSTCSVVTAPYKMEGDPVGVLAVIGPTRMYYDRIIPIVDISAKILSSALNHSD
ncbi:MAG: heat-inducible transcription repressor HrcA [Gammaproteobacteria bacterium]|nr:heat-inducible transcription repressor HrcA [Gammaproteobacteria bacterium]